MENTITNKKTNKNPETCPFRKFVKSIPMATCGLALGLAALGNLIIQKYTSNTAEIVRNTLGIISFFVLCVFFLKIIFDNKHAKEELKTPIPASVLPTSTMAAMLLCTYLLEYLPTTATALWYVAVVAHICMMVYFFRRFFADLKLNTVFPSYFITFVGLVTASVTAPDMGALYIGIAAFYIGIALYFACLFLVILRFAKVPLKHFPEPARPTLAIFTAPASLLIVGYFKSFIAPNGGIPNATSTDKAVIYTLLIFAVLSYIFVLATIIPSLLRRFYPTFSSFTFPFVISAIAFRLGFNFVQKMNASLSFLTTIADISLWVAVVAVAYVFFQYVRHFFVWLKY